MKQFKPWFIVTFLWLPLAFSLLLNPGRNGSNISSFNAAELSALGFFGLLMAVSFFINALPTSARSFACTSQDATGRTVGTAWFAFVLGLFSIYYAATGLARLYAG